MAKYYIISISNLIDTFSRTQAGKEFDFTLATSESSLSESRISEDDILLVSIDDRVYYQLKVINKTEDEIRFKKIFEIEKSIGYTVDEEGIIIEIDKKVFDSICSKLFDHFVNETAPSPEVEINPEVYIKEKYTGRFVFQVLTYLNELDNLNSLKPFFKVNSDPTYTSIKTDEVSLTSIFKTSENKLSKDELTFNDGKPRFFEDVIFFWENKNFYLSTEWTSGKDSRLDLDSFKKLIENYYPKYSIYEENGNYFFTDKTQGKIKINQIDFDINSFHESFEGTGLNYTENLITRFTTSLITKPFLILTGLTGSGKTKLAQAFVKWISESKEQYKIIPVGADWTNREPLLGFPNGLNKKEYILPDSGALQLIFEAQKEENENKPYFLILDEMNLSHVERYFADFLSIMESKDSIKLYSGEQRYSEYKEEDDTFNKEDEIPKEISWPKNLFIIGTVNIDETTYMFSPKVLDRANVIEFRISHNEMKDYLENSGELNLNKLHVGENKDSPGLGAQFGASFVSMAKNNEPNKIDVSVLKDFFEELQEVGAEFGYRSASEIKLLISNLGKNDEFIEGYLEKDKFSPDNLFNHKVDIAIMQKLLPKLHGSRKKLVKPLDKLASLCLEPAEKRKKEDLEKEKSYFALYLSDYLKSSTNLDDNWKIKYPISFEKIKRMHKNLLDNGFVSYAEA